MSTSPLSFDPYIVYNLPGPAFLDIGCGYGKWGFLLRSYRAMEYGADFRITGVDLFQPHIDSLRPRGLYDDLKCCSATELPFPDKSFDSAVCCEVLEHLPGGAGPRLFSELQRVCRKAFVVTTPLYDCYRGGGETLDGFNPHEAHQYCYRLPEFKALGFTQVIGLGSRLPSWKARTALSSLSHFFPSLGRYGMGFWWSDGQRRGIGYE